MSRELVGIRHKEEAYIAKGHPKYGEIKERPGILNLVDKIDTKPSPDGAAHWIRVWYEVEGHGTFVTELRTEECDQFIYKVDA